jgi:hypothetical protein
VAPDGRVFSQAIAPFGFDASFAARAKTDEPLLDYFVHSFTSSPVEDSLLVTFVPAPQAVGDWSFVMTHSAEPSGEVQVAGSPLPFSVPTGALYSFNLSAASLTAGEALVVDLSAAVRNCTCSTLFSCSMLAQLCAPCSDLEQWLLCLQDNMAYTSK